MNLSRHQGLGIEQILNGNFEGPLFVQNAVNLIYR